MKNFAQISFRGGGLVVPARDRYDREVAFEHAETYARLHGRVRLDLNGNTLHIGLNGSSGHRCASCDEVLGLLTYEIGTRHMCARCIRVSAAPKARRLPGETVRQPSRPLVDPPQR
jgi:hypothetical protein